MGSRDTQKHCRTPRNIAGHTESLQDAQLALPSVSGASQGWGQSSAGAHSDLDRLGIRARSTLGSAKLLQSSLHGVQAAPFTPQHFFHILGCPERQICVRRGWEHRCPSSVCCCELVPLAAGGSWQSFALFPFSSQHVPIIFSHPFLICVAWALAGGCKVPAELCFPLLSFPKSQSNVSKVGALICSLGTKITLELLHLCR